MPTILDNSVLMWNAANSEWRPVLLDPSGHGGTVTFNTVGVHYWRVPRNAVWGRVQATGGTGSAGTNGTDGGDGTINASGSGGEGSTGENGGDGNDGKAIKVNFQIIASGGAGGSKGYGGGGGAGTTSSGQLAEATDGRGPYAGGHGISGYTNNQGTWHQGEVGRPWGYGDTSPSAATSGNLSPANGGTGDQGGGNGGDGTTSGYAGNGDYIGGGGAGGYLGSGGGGGGFGGVYTYSEEYEQYYYLHTAGKGGKGGQGQAGVAGQSVDMAYNLSAYSGSLIPIEITSGEGSASITITW